MPTLEEAGIGQRPPFVRAVAINDRPFEILSAVINPDGYDHKPELVAHLRFLGRDSSGDPVLDAEGRELHACSWSAGLTHQRRDIAAYFERNREPLGPCQFEFRAPTRPGGDPYAHIVTYRGRIDARYGLDGTVEAAGRPRPPTGNGRAVSRAVAGSTSEPRPYEDDIPDDLPF